MSAAIFNAPVKREVSELSLLFEISQILDQNLDLKDALYPILKVISKNMGMMRGTITIRRGETDKIIIHEAYGLSETQKQKGQYKLGEGITGKVFETGKPAIVPRISREPLFLDRTGARKKLPKSEISFICVPIKVKNECVGALSCDRLFSDDVSLNEDVRLLSVIASMIAISFDFRRNLLDEKKRLLEENTLLQMQLQDRFNPTNIIGTSHQMQLVFDQISQVAKTDTTVLLRGETGVGKELVANALHYSSLRAAKPVIRVNLAALPESLIESELFGYEKGAFTGAVSQRKGRFELAHGGTIFLDEIGDLSPNIQVKLLRVLQEREIERIGGTSTIPVNVRIIAATNRDLEQLMVEEQFRMDLYYRLNVFPIVIPPLRERKTDTLLLADHFVEKYSRIYSKNIRRISTPAIDMMMAYHWPGNVRELENCIERAVLVSNDDVIHGHHLPPSLQTAEASGTGFKGDLNSALENYEKELIIDALKQSRGVMAKAATQLGITERIMGLRVNYYNIDFKRFRK